MVITKKTQTQTQPKFTFCYPTSSLKVISKYHFSAEILNKKNDLYTYEDDEYFGLSIRSCVSSTHNKKQKKVGKIIKKRIKKKNKKYLRRRGKKLCCKKGIVTRLGKMEGTCDNPNSTVLDKALTEFGLNNEICNEMFKICCHDKIVGEQM